MDEWSNICSSFLFVGNTSAYRYNIMAEARRKAIPEFMRFNIVESEVRNIV